MQPLKGLEPPSDGIYVFIGKTLEENRDRQEYCGSCLRWTALTNLWLLASTFSTSLSAELSSATAH